ncbi:MAG: hypothetical protein EPN60_16080 [Nevskiaceae bacterium]|nr:MAG: hypothetical protein EPN60_16080 [Nevskiaceae bacterium]
MGRPPEFKDIATRKNFVLRWVNGAGRHRALYLERRGQTYQARISGFGLRPRNWHFQSLVNLPTQLSLIVNGWGDGWRVEQGAARSPLEYAHIQAWHQRRQDQAPGMYA